MVGLPVALPAGGGCDRVIVGVQSMGSRLFASRSYGLYGEFRLFTMRGFRRSRVCLDLSRALS